ncbi:MAG: hypothetical protein AAB353_12980 [Candidatus Hydrogenedentota bacterium]
MESIEFTTVVKDGIIEIPVRYRGLLKPSVHVILQNEEEAQQSDIIHTLLEHPLKAVDFRPLSREEAHARK